MQAYKTAAKIEQEGESAEGTAHASATRRISLDSLPR
jgi:hypothetical protein